MPSDRGLQFIQDTEYAARHLFQGIEDAYRELRQVESEIAQLVAESKSWQKEADKYEKGEFQKFSAIAQVFVAASKERSRLAIDKEATLDSIQHRLLDKKEALAVLSGAVLQIAKQGISSVHGSLPAARRSGRQVAGLPIADVVWQARNQTMHFEEGCNAQVIAVFQKLEEAFGDDLSLTKNPAKNMALRVLIALDWMQYETYCADLSTLL